MSDIRASASLLVLLGVVLLAVFIPVFGVDPNAIHPDASVLPPWPLEGHQAGFWLGTDDLGRDLLGRIAVGARVSLFIGLATAVVSVVIGTLYGTVAALSSHKIDTAMMRFVDVLYALPGLMIVILFSVFLGRGLLSLVLALALFSWPDTARMVRGQMLGLKQQEFVEAFHSIGGSLFRLVTQHLLPNSAGLIILSASITVPRSILTESTLSFIGLGVEPPLSSWGTLASEGWQLVRVAPHLLLFPASFIFLSMIALNLFGDRLREVTDPKHTN